MSKYTTEVRFLCETAAGYTESQGFNSIDAILNTSAPLVFNFDFPIFDEDYRLPLEKKILRHYYTREISEETVGLWKLRLQDRLCMIMPYYNQLYQSELLQFNPLYDVDLTRTHEGESEGNESHANTGTFEETRTDSSTNTDTISGTSTDSGTERHVKDAEISENIITDTDISNDVITSHDYVLGESKTLTISEHTDDDLTHGKSEQTTLGSTVTDTTNGTRWDMHSDTPQGALNGVISDDYLTDVHKIIDDNQVNTKVGSGSDTVATTGTDQRDITVAGSHTENNSQTMDEDTGELTTRTEDTDVTRTLTDDATNTTTFGKVVNTTGNNVSEFSAESERNSETNDTGSKHSTSTDEYVERITGKQGSVSYSKMIMEFRQSFLNIDKMIIDDLSYLFFGLWE